MYLIARILCIVALTSAKLIKNDLIKRNEDTLNVSERNSNDFNDTLWVLSLNVDDLTFNKLFAANQDEKKVFKRIIAPAIENFKAQNSRRVKKDDPMKILSEENQQTSKDRDIDIKYKNLKNIKKEIKMILNKFFITHINDSESYMLENSKGQPQLKIYFMGPYTSLVLTSGKTRYQYFVNPPSPLPGWFYEYHNLGDGNRSYVEIPKSVQDDFSNKLLKLITMFFSLPV